MITEKYNKTAVFLHWSIALGIFFNLALIWSVSFLPDNWVRPVINTHKSIGIVILFLIVLRIFWRLFHYPPKPPIAYKKWEQRLSHLTHKSLYLLILFIPLSGWIMDSAWKDASKNPMHLFGTIEFPRITWVMNLSPLIKEHWHSFFAQVHFFLALIMIVFILLHLSGVIKHQWIDKQKEIQRMWF